MLSGHKIKIKSLKAERKLIERFSFYLFEINIFFCMRDDDLSRNDFSQGRIVLYKGPFIYDVSIF